VNRAEFESELIKLLNRHFKKNTLREFPGGVTIEERRLSQSHRKTIRLLLESFCHAVESRAIDVFWQSRKKNKLAKKPEKIGQGLLAVFLKGVIPTNARGLVLREVVSGIGFVDIGVVLSNRLHVVEMKILSSKFVGVSQLQTYMRTEDRREGWLVVFDARPASRRQPIPETIKTVTGVVKVLRACLKIPAIP